MMNKLESNNNIFESIKHIDEYGKEYWYARELCTVLKYSEYRKFIPVLQKATISCKNSSQNVNDHFAHMAEMVNIGSKAKREVSNYKLSRYACYLIAQNGDSRKKVIALAQTYFAIQTRKMELTEQDYSTLSEDERRIYQRNLTKKGNYSLNQAAALVGVKNFDLFHNFGYRGLYNGETANDIAKRKKLRYHEDILDNMGSEELADNLFRIVQTESKLKRGKIKGEKNANLAHYNIGKIVREAIKKAGGAMPELLPTPAKSIKELEKERKIINTSNESKLNERIKSHNII